MSSFLFPADFEKSENLMMSQEQVESETVLASYRKFLGEFIKKGYPDAVFLREYYDKAASALEKSSAEDRQLAQKARNLVPIEHRTPKHAVVPLESLYVHRIWVVGDVSGNVEFADAMITQPKSDKWQNLLWIYSNPVNSGKPVKMGERMVVVVGGPMQALNHTLLKVDFKRTMESWNERPSWISDYLALLDVMVGKKAYVAMSDIMRMILLWFMGGVYIDVKIKFEAGAEEFFEGPMVAQDHLMCVCVKFMENWAMMSRSGCKMAEKILNEALVKLSTLASAIGRMPVNWSDPSKKYSKAHKDLHETHGVWPILQSKYIERVVFFQQVDPPLKVTNPREMNSWVDDDGVEFDWLKK